MALDTDLGVQGNLQAYKFYLRPTVHTLYGNLYYRKKTTTKHQANVQRLLETLARNGILTTWQIAKLSYPDDNSMVHNKEKEFRRLLIGRNDRDKRSGGILDRGLVVRDGITYKRGPTTSYRLSLTGILYCLDVLELGNHEIDIIASKYAKVLPKVFGKWDYLKSVIGDDVYKLKILAKGLLLDNPQIVSAPDTPFYELMSFITTKYRKNYEYISEKDLAEQISYWFYTNLLYSPDIRNIKKNERARVRLKSVFDGDKELKKWYFSFFQQAKQFYNKRLETLTKSNVF